MKKKFDISLFYSNDLSEFDKWVEAKLAYLNTKLDHELRYTRNEEFVSI
ncbi:MAG: hypothetical protein J6S85_09850 [Methanobrevibacter sp.]|nr:hypothetical protein [Methanobrevibacter sp.]